MSDESSVSDLMNFLQKILMELDQNVKEISYDGLQFILQKRFGVRVTLRTIQKTLQGGVWTITFGWGRGKDYLHRIPEGIQTIENMT
jgi:hypothetical protein